MVDEKLNVDVNKQQETPSLCVLDIDDLFIELHKKATAKIKNQNKVIIQNSAIEGKGKNLEFYGPGKHIIAALPASSGKNDTIDKAAALQALQDYIQWFAGPDVSSKIKDTDLIEIDSADDKDDKKTSTHKESIVPNFLNYLLLEDSEPSEPGEPSEPSEPSTPPADGEPDKDDKDSSKAGYYVSYVIDIEGRPFATFAEVFKKFGKAVLNLIGKFGIRFGRINGPTATVTIDDIGNALDTVLKKIDPEELKQKFQANVKEEYPQTSAQSEIFDYPTITKHLKGKLDKKDRTKLEQSNAKYSFCVKVHRDDKSKKVINKGAIATLITRSIQGIFKTIRNAVSADDVILVNGYSENDKTKNKPATQLSPNKNDDVFDEAMISDVGNLILEAAKAKKPLKDVKEQMEKYFQEQADKLFSSLPTHKTSIADSKDVVQQIRTIGADDEKTFNKILQHTNAFLLELEFEKKDEGKTPTDVSTSLRRLYVGKVLLETLLEAIEKAPDNIKTNIEKIFSNLANNNEFLTARGKTAAEEAEIFEFTDESKKESMKLASNLYNMLFEDQLLLEKADEFVSKCMAEIDRVGHENISKNIDEFRKNWKANIEKIKSNVDSSNEKGLPSELSSRTENAKSYVSYLKKNYVKGADSTPFDKSIISKLRTNLKSTDQAKRIFASYGAKSEDKKFDKQDTPLKDSSAPEIPEYYAAWKALQKLPDGPKAGEEDEEKKGGDDEKITITFKDIDDPSQLSNPEDLTDDDKQKYKTVGEPLELVPGEDVKIPEIKNKGKFEFMGFEPDPENMDSTGDTYAMYTRNGPDTVKISFYDTDPEKNEKIGDPLKEVEVEKGKAINANEKAEAAISELNKKFQDEEKDGYTLKGWNIDPATKAEEDMDMFPKYVKKEDEDKTFTVSFQYPPDPENKDKVEEVPGDDATQKVKAGEAAKAPEPPEIEGWKFKKWDSDFSNVTDDMVVLAEYQKPGQYIFKAPKDPEKPDDLQTLGDPIEYEEGKTPEPPEPPTFDGYEFEKWDPDPKDFKDGFEGDKDIVATYKKKDDKKPGSYIFKAPKDPEKPDGEFDIVDEIAFEEGKTPKPPTAPDREGYEFEKWDPDPETLTEKPDEDVDIVAKYKKKDEPPSKGDMIHAFYVLPDYAGILDDDTITITFRAPKPDESDPTKVDVDKSEPFGEKYEIAKETPIAVDEKTGQLKDGDKEIITPPDLSKAGYTFDRWEPDPKNGFDDDKEITAQYKEDKKNRQHSELKPGGDYDFYIVPMKGLKYKDNSQKK